VTVPDDANRYGRPVRSLNAGRLWTGGVVVGVAIGSLLSGVARSAVRTGP
jgi:hypothetical protein